MGTKKLLIVLLNVFVVFLLTGIFIGYIKDSALKKDEKIQVPDPSAINSPKKTS